MDVAHHLQSLCLKKTDIMTLNTFVLNPKGCQINDQITLGVV
jgi:hypothetical protein